MVLRTRANLEVAAVLLTAALHFVFYDLLPGRGVFILVTAIAWTTYCTFRVRRTPDARREYGLSLYGLRQSTWAALVVFLAGTAFCLAVALARGGVHFAPSMLIVALLYPFWGLLQQLLVQAMVVRNLASHISRPLVVAIAAVLFGAIHLPHLALAVATAILGAVLTVIFLRWRNVWPLGVCHGWLGVLFYYWVLQRDPWVEILTGS